MLSEHWEVDIFYYLGDRTVIKTDGRSTSTASLFYYLGDRTVIKTRKLRTVVLEPFYYLGDRTVIKTPSKEDLYQLRILLPGRSYGNQDRAL